MIPNGPILISGSTGMLGTDLVEYFTSKLGRERVLPLTRDKFDITHLNQVRSVMRELKPSVLINAAAYTNVDGAEKERELAKALNADGPENLAIACEEQGTKLVHFSSDYVFDGIHTAPWLEEDTTSPVTPNYYAETKLSGEKAVLRYANSLVLRVQWLYGKKKDRFSPLKTKTSFTPLVDQFGAPTWTLEIAETVFKLLEKNTKGLFHFAYDDSASWLQVFEFVKATWGLNTELVGKKASDLGLPAKRPLYCVLSNKKICSALGISGLGSWKAPLKKFLAETGN